MLVAVADFYKSYRSPKMSKRPKGMRILERIDQVEESKDVAFMTGAILTVRDSYRLATALARKTTKSTFTALTVI